MDILTQALTGALTAQCAAKQQQMKQATVIGLVAGLIADLDVLITSRQDPLLTLEYHRHFTHSVFFIPLGALLAALLLWPILRKHLGFAQIYGFSLLGYLFSGFIDACTSYGTHLFWPLYPEAVAFHIIAIVDPLFTLILLVSMLLALGKKNRLVARIGLGLAGLYLIFGWYQLHSATRISEQLAEQRGHQPAALLLKPTLGNLLLWRSVYRHQEHYYVDAVRVSPFSEDRIYPGEAVKRFDVQALLQNLPDDSVLAGDLQRFREFSKDYLARSPVQANFLIDVRYSMLPNSSAPLWGIEFDAQQPDKHARYRITRDSGSQVRQRFVDMLMGREIE